MIITGGTYQERCRYPYRDKIMGSGLRAACLLSDIDKDIRLVTAVDSEFLSLAQVTSGAFSFSADWHERDKSVSFNYYTPLSIPTIRGRSAKSEEIHINDNVALVYGMMETTSSAKADHIILDPQQAQGRINIDRSRYHCNHLALIANKSETMRLGNNDEITIAAKNILTTYEADVVITKLGAKGALVTTAKYQDSVGPHPTDYVMPVGSGDAFAAGFAWAWGGLKADPIEAARIGSLMAAFYVSTEILPFPANRALTKVDDTALLASKDIKIYLAGPFFSLPELWLVDMLSPIIIGLGASVFSPFHDIGRGGIEVAKKDLDGLDGCSAVLALLDHLDAGTVFEVGWAIKKGIPVVGYATNIQEEALKMLKGSGVELQNDLSTAVYRAIWRGMGALPIL